MRVTLGRLFLLGALLLAGCAGEDGEDVDSAEADTTATEESADLMGDWEPQETLAEGFDPYGIYLPQTRVERDQYVFDHLFMGAPSDFEAYWGGEREEPPVWIEVVDTTSALVETEIGMVHEGSYRIWAESFRVTPEEVLFRGVHEQLGEVQFSGRMDGAALKSAQEAGPNAFGPNVTVLTGDLLFGGSLTQGLSLYWYGGD